MGGETKLKTSLFFPSHWHLKEDSLPLSLLFLCDFLQKASPPSNLRIPAVGPEEQNTKPGGENRRPGQAGRTQALPLGWQLERGGAEVPLSLPSLRASGRAASSTLGNTWKNCGWSLRRAGIGEGWEGKGLQWAMMP